VTDPRTLHIFREDFSLEEGWRLIRWCLERGANEFNVYGLLCDGSSDAPLKAFDRLVESHRMPPALRHDLSGEAKSVELWTLNETTLEALQVAFPRGLFDYDPRPGAWFEDLMLYRGTELMLGIVTHEGEGVLRLAPRELPDFQAAGFASRAEGRWVDFA
jgi:hypothetical protein